MPHPLPLPMTSRNENRTAGTAEVGTGRGAVVGSVGSSTFTRSTNLNPGTASLRCMCWNAHGIGAELEQHELLEHIMESKLDLAFICETNLQARQAKGLELNERIRGKYVVLHTEDEEQTRGCGAILLIRSEWKPHIHSWSGTTGRAITVRLRFKGATITFIGAHVPHRSKQRETREAVTKYIKEQVQRAQEAGDHVVAGGDWNAVVCPAEDRWHEDKETGEVVPSRGERTGSEVLRRLLAGGLTDPWRERFPTAREWTWDRAGAKQDESVPGGRRTFHSYARLDFFLTSASLAERILGVGLDKCPEELNSDHAPIYLELDLSRWSARTRTVMDRQPRLRPDKATEEHWKEFSKAVSEALQKNELTRAAHRAIKKHGRLTADMRNYDISGLDAAFTSCVMQAAKAAIPKTRPPRMEKPVHRPWSSSRVMRRQIRRLPSEGPAGQSDDRRISDSERTAGGEASARSPPGGRAGRQRDQAVRGTAAARGGRGRGAGKAGADTGACPGAAQEPS